ncbi:hypothetical protein [Desulfitobacterium dehalogenans]|nr:hypothetical protein [Desulfitobacterium dehalogenans]
MRNLKEMYIELREPIFGYLLRLSGEYDLAEGLTVRASCGYQYNQAYP